MTIYKLTNVKVAVPENYLILCMTEKELRKMLSPDWKASLLYEDQDGNLYSFHRDTKSVIIVRKGDRQT